MRTQAILPLTLLLALVVGCSEGGIGGTGSIVAGPTPLVVTGQANKGPFEAGAAVSATRLGDGAAAQGQTTSNLGEFSLLLPPDAAYVLRVSGSYFSETSGVQVDSGLVLAGVVAPQDGEPANVNLATHLIHRRVLALVDGGMAVGTAINAVSNELVLALSGLLPAPSNPLVFSQLVLLSAAQATPNDEGNAWLLALSALLETAGGSSINDLLASMVLDFEDDGTFDGSILAQLEASVSQVNPDAVHQNLINLVPAFRQNLLVASGAVTAEQAAAVNCRVFGSNLLCAGEQTLPAGSLDSTLDLLGSVASQSVSIAAIVGDLNQFIDTDRDGLVNAVDTDDDNDGIEDSSDAAPYDNQLAVTPGGVL